jgi:sulfite reductase alpha subunit-like flavoprotein
MPRYYTIASSNLKYPEEVKIAISLTKDILPSGELRYGLTSKYINDIYESVRDFS